MTAIPENEWPESLVKVSEKVANFNSTPLNEHGDLQSVPRLGEVTETNLKAAECDTVKKLIGMYLFKGSTQPNLQAWLEGIEIRPQEARPVSIVIHNYCAAQDL